MGDSELEAAGYAALAVLGVSLIIHAATGDCWLWAFVLLAIAVGLMAAAVINE